MRSHPLPVECADSHRAPVHMAAAERDFGRDGVASIAVRMPRGHVPVDVDAPERAVVHRIANSHLLGTVDVADVMEVGGG